MNRIISVFIIVFCFLCDMHAEKYKVILSTFDNTMIGKSVARKNLVFEDSDTIRFGAGGTLCVMKAKSTNAITIDEMSFRLKKACTLRDFLSNNSNEMKVSVKERYGLSTGDNIKRKSGGITIYSLFDKLYIEAEPKYKDNAMAKAEVIVGSEKIVTTDIKKTSDGTQYILTKDMLGEINVKKIKVNIIETNPIDNSDEYVYRDLQIRIIR